MKLFAAKMKKNNNPGNVQLKTAKPSHTGASRTAPVKSTRDHIMQLHKTIGNRAVTQMIENGTFQLPQEPALQLSQVLQMLSVKVDITNDRGTYHGVNKKSDETEENLEGAGTRGELVKERMEKIQQNEDWDVYDCAEPNALSKLVAGSTNHTIARDMTTAQVGDAEAKHGHGDWHYKAPCKNCRQWVRGNKGNFSIANRVIPGWNRSVDQSRTRGRRPPENE